MEFFNTIRMQAQLKELDTLHPKAALSQDHQRYTPEPLDHRLPYKRDVDRIIHTKAYARYSDKTQVVYLVDNDHVTHRALHVQLVSNFAKGIAEILQLNLDLVEAISLGHDVGHPPFGHEGEGYLSALTQEYGKQSFTHSLQSCRLFMEIEPINLGLNVYDGFLCHDGGLSSTQLLPRFGKTWVEHEKDKKAKIANPQVNIMPATLEGCLVKLCDTISYVGRDIEDAIQLGILDRKEVPQTLLGNSNSAILTTLAQDIIRCSHGKDYIALSDSCHEAVKTIRQFNFEKIYVHPKLKVESHKIKTAYRILFETLLEDFTKHQQSSHLWKEFLHSKKETYLKQSTAIQMVVDYISGMTDHYFIRTLEKLILPRRITL